MLALSRTLLPSLLGPSTRKVAAKAVGLRFYSIMSPDPGYNNLTMGPYPKTKEERILAAKKYNLIPEDYETYPEDEGFGDYPKLPEIGVANRDPYDDYDDPRDRRFYGEPFHLYTDLFEYERYDPKWREKEPYPWYVTRGIFLLCWLFPPAIYYGIEHYELNINQPWKQRRVWPCVSDPSNLRTVYSFPDEVSGSSHGGHH